MSASAPITPQGGPAGGPAGGPSGAPMGDPAAMAQMLDMFSGMTGMLNDSRTVLACALAIYAWDWLVTLPQGELSQPMSKNACSPRLCVQSADTSGRIGHICQRISHSSSTASEQDSPHFEQLFTGLMPLARASQLYHLLPFYHPLLVLREHPSWVLCGWIRLINRFGAQWVCEQAALKDSSGRAD